MNQNRKTKVKRTLAAALSVLTALSAPASLSAAEVDNSPHEVNEAEAQAGTTKNTMVTYEQTATDSIFTVTIPKSIALGSDKTAEYEVKVKGAIDSDETVTVKPKDMKTDTADVIDFEMTEKNGRKDPVTATVTQDNDTWNNTEVTDAGTAKSGTISAPGLVRGEWQGNFDFLINLNVAGASESGGGSSVDIESIAQSFYENPTELRPFKDGGVYPVGTELHNFPNGDGTGQCIETAYADGVKVIDKYNVTGEGSSNYGLYDHDSIDNGGHITFEKSGTFTATGRNWGRDSATVTFSISDNAVTQFKHLCENVGYSDELQIAIPKELNLEVCNYSKLITFEEASSKEELLSSKANGIYGWITPSGEKRLIFKMDGVATGTTSSYDIKINNLDDPDKTIVKSIKICA